MGKYRKLILIAGSVIIIILITLLLVTQNQKKDVLNLDEIKDIQTSIEKRIPHVKIRTLGEIDINGGSESQINTDQLKKIQDMKIKLPDALYDLRPVSTVLTEDTEYVINLDIMKTNEELSKYEIFKPLPASLNNKSFTINLGKQVSLQYISGNIRYDIIIAKLHKLVLPKDVNEREVTASLLNLPILPKTLQIKLQSLNDWKLMSPNPVAGASTDLVNINGIQAFLTVKKNPQNTYIRSTITWLKNGIVYTIHSNTDESDIKAVAKSML